MIDLIIRILFLITFICIIGFTIYCWQNILLNHFTKTGYFIITFLEIVLFSIFITQCVQASTIETIQDDIKKEMSNNVYVDNALISPEAIEIIEEIIKLENTNEN